MTLHYDPADGSYTSIIPSGTEAFRQEVGAFFGFRTEVVRDHSRCLHEASEHCECRAVDLYVAAPGGRPLFEWALAHAEHLGIQSVIHNHRVWGFGEWFERTYHGASPHTDHVHIGLTKLAAASLTSRQVQDALGIGDDMTPEQEAKLDKVIALLTEQRNDPKTGKPKTQEATDIIERKVNALAKYPGSVIVFHDDGSVASVDGTPV